MSHLYDSAHPQPAGYRDVDVRPLATERPPGLRLVDVREPSELEGVLGHIEGVSPAPLATVREAVAPWPRDTEVLLICRSGARSAKAAAQLVELGFTRVMNLRGGMLAWNTEELPVVRLRSGEPPTLTDVRDTLRDRLQEALPRESSRAEPGAVMDARQAMPPPRLEAPPRESSRAEPGTVLDTLLATPPPRLEAPPREPSRAEPGAVMDARQATPPPRLEAPPREPSRTEPGTVLDTLLATPPLRQETPPREPSRAELTAALDALQASPPSGLVDPASFERALRELRDLLAVARPGGTSR
ncbi:rhodanese-like domain-containing protein [Myxococcus qinghaiensis]|uniref:rhodanese-like domain-containing protein n=1 Tax=Myxococcus qinghaiensis TaxID=2906758 RepID=UPI0020A7F43D|nr:rhodanese-like domain-containing protein [Myxococcus qinghaiensis]MCP3166104.1 hypothetical protein [Myxococcus qinghaiensis]